MSEQEVLLPADALHSFVGSGSHRPHDCPRRSARVPQGQHMTADFKPASGRSPVQERMLRNYLGAARFGFNWALGQLANSLAGGFDVVGVGDLNVKGMSNKQRRLGRYLTDAALGEVRRILTYKTADHDHHLVVMDRFYPSSKTCSVCGAVKAKLPLHIRTFDCDLCGVSLDRDVNAAHNIAGDVAGLRPETQNAASRLCETWTGHRQR